MLTCDKCGAKGFITVEEGELHCVLCGFVWYLERSGGQAHEAGRKRGTLTGTRAPLQRRDPWPGAE
jgi:uncharacterized Zn finger protein (UPF0148 family)